MGRPVAEVHRVQNAEGAQALAAALLSPTRDRPVVVVSTAAGRDRPYVDVDQIAADLDGVAEVHVIPTGEVSWVYSRAMPDMTQVYGGASRVYPPGLEWTTQPHRSPLRFAFADDVRGVIAQALVTDAQGMAVDGGLTLSSVFAESVPARGVVKGVVGGRVFVGLDDDGLATIWPEFVSAGVDAERLAAKGMAVKGLLDRRTKRLDVAGMLREPADALSAYVGGAQVLGRVTGVQKDTIAVELFPGVRANLGPVAAAGRPDADLRMYFSVGDVLVVKVLEAGDGEGRRWRLSSARADSAGEVLDAPSLLPDGPAWLVLPPPAPESDDVEELLADEAESELAFSPAALPPPAAAADDSVLSSMQAERDALAEVVAQLEHKQRHALKRLDQAKERLRRETQRATRAITERDALRQHLASAAGDGELFESPEEQFDFELKLAWARRIPKAEKSSRALARYSIGPGFFSSWDGVEGIERSKVVDVVVEVLTGIADTQPGRQVHQLRSGTGGNSPRVARPNGDTCWRASLQVNTAAARRLHYWRRSDGSIELSAVRLHDDFRP
jgi:hypothetical protein